jgi:GST-like protein
MVRPAEIPRAVPATRDATAFVISLLPSRTENVVIDLFTWSTPNGRKVSIMLEECGLTYAAHPIDINSGDQFKPEFIALNLNSKIPVIVDRDAPGANMILAESGAILIYLAEKAGRLLPSDRFNRACVLQWLMFQMGGVGPMFGQAHHFLRAKDRNDYGIKRYGGEVRRLYGVINERFGQSRYLAGGEYTIADVATFPWISRHDWHGVDLREFPNVARWYAEISRRPAVRRGMEVPSLT